MTWQFVIVTAMASLAFFFAIRTITEVVRLKESLEKLKKIMCDNREDNK